MLRAFLMPFLRQVHALRGPPTFIMLTAKI
jgi:hypothetical protein